MSEEKKYCKFCGDVIYQDDGVCAHTDEILEFLEFDEQPYYHYPVCCPNPYLEDCKSPEAAERLLLLMGHPAWAKRADIVRQRMAS